MYYLCRKEGLERSAGNMNNKDRSKIHWSHVLPCTTLQDTRIKFSRDQHVSASG